MTLPSIEEKLRDAVEVLHFEVPTRQIQNSARSRKRRRLAVVSAALVVLVVAVVLPVVLPKDHGGPTTAAAALLRTADSAEKQPWTPPAPGQYWYRQTKEIQQDGVSGADNIFLPFTYESWQAPDCSGRTQEQVGTQFTFYTEQDRQAWVKAGRPQSEAGQSDSWTNPSGSCVDFGRSGMSLQELIDLPTDEATLEAMIQKAAHSAGPSPVEETWTIFTDLSRAPLSPQARAALFRVVAANVPDVHYLGPMKDPLGREGVGVARDVGSDRAVIIYDPVTGQFMASEKIITQVNPDWPVPVGTVVGPTVDVSSGWVDSMTARPA
jgi:hypothetical protein